MAKPTTGENFGLSGHVGKTGSPKLVIDVEEKGEWSFEMTPELLPYQHKANVGMSYRVTGEKTTISGNGTIRSGEIGLNNVYSATNGVGTVTLVFGNGRQLTMRGRFAYVRVGGKGTEPKRISFVIVGDVTESNDVESGAPTEAAV